MMPLGLRNEDLCVAIANVRKWRIAAANSPPKSPPTASAFRGIATVPSRQIAFKKPRHLSIKVTNRGRGSYAKVLQTGAPEKPAGSRW